MLWWAHVTKIPEDNKIEVLSKGIPKGSKGKTWIGGHTDPISWGGTNLWWKKAQNQAKKKRPSLRINSLIPHFSLS